MSDLAAKIKEARDAGYADDQILAKVRESGVSAAQIDEALQAGHKPGDILGKLTQVAPATPWEQLVRGAGIATRGAVKGVAGLPMMIQDGLNAPVRAGIEAVNRATGSQYPVPARSTANIVDGGLTQFGLPEPQNRVERLTEGGGAVLGGSAGTKVLAEGLKRGLPYASQATKKILDLFASNPGAQAGAGALSLGATDVAQEDFGITDPKTLAAIGLGVGVVYPQGQAARTTAPVRAVESAVRPFTEEGRRAIAGSVLDRVSVDSRAAANRIDAGFPEYVPGSRPFTSEVAGDAGLLGAEGPLFKALDQRNLRGQRVSERNDARQNFMTRMARDPMAVLRAEQKRDAMTAPLRDAAFAAARANGPIDPAAFQAGPVQNVMGTIAQIQRSPAGVRMDVEQAMGKAVDRLRMARSPEELYEVRKDLRAASQGKYNAQDPSMRLARGQLEDVIRSIDQELENVAPGFGKYLNRYSQMSKPIDQMRSLQQVRDGSQLTGIDPLTGNDIFSPAALRQRATALLADRNQRLSKTQEAALTRIIDDVRRAAGTTSGVARAPGSDTFKNMSMGSLIGRVIGEKTYGEAPGVAGNVPRSVVGLNWLYALPDQAVADLLVEAMLDPFLYRDLVRTASSVRIEPFSQALKAKAAESGILAGTTGAQQNLDLGGTQP